MDKIIEKLEALKLERELPNDQTGDYNVGYVKALCVAMRLVENLTIPLVIDWTPLSERQPPEQGHYLVHRPTSFPKNYRGSVAEYYEDNQTFYCEFGDSPIEDVTHWANIPTDPL